MPASSEASSRKSAPSRSSKSRRGAALGASSVKRYSTWLELGERRQKGNGGASFLDTPLESDTFPAAIQQDKVLPRRQIGVDREGDQFILPIAVKVIAKRKAGQLDFGPSAP